MGQRPGDMLIRRRKGVDHILGKDENSNAQYATQCNPLSQYGRRVGRPSGIHRKTAEEDTPQKVAERADLGYQELKALHRDRTYFTDRGLSGCNQTAKGC